MSLLFTPSSLSEIIGNTSAISQVRQWAEGWQRGQPQKPLLIWGPPGTGKTAIAHAIASEFGWELFEFNSSDLRDEETVNRILKNASQSSSLLSNYRLLLIDDVDALSGSNDKGGAGAISSLLSKSRQPIILTALDLYDRKLQTIRQHCLPIQLRRVHAASISKLLSFIASQKRMQVTSQQIAQIASSSGGDVRAAINDLQAGNFSSIRDIQKSIFETLQSIFSSNSYSEARKAAFFSDTDHDTLKLWIAHNISNCYSKPFEVADAYEALSKADIFDGRISRTQYHGYLRYSTDLMSAGVAVAKTSKLGYQKLEFPSFLKQMGESKSLRSVRTLVLRKIALACHCSLQGAQSYFGIFGQLAKKGKLPRSLGFEEDEIDFLKKQV
ncbi:MAG: replication factor C large subunit [Candidatus Anstonellaceae archaeon]